MSGRDPVKKTFAQHLGELRRRLFWSVLSLLFGGGLGYMLREPIQAALLQPLDQPLYYTSPTGGFNFIFNICLFFGIIFSVPVITYQILRFLEPVIPGSGKRFIAKLLLASISLTVAGVAFAYYVSLPAALHFLTGFNQGDIHSLITTDSYFSFVSVYLAGFAVLFQLPLIMLIINKITPIGPGSIMRKQGLVVLLSFVVAAIMTPTPDPLNQGIMAVPIILLYQLSGVLVWLANRPRRKGKTVKSDKRQQKLAAKQAQQEQKQALAANRAAVKEYQAQLKAYNKQQRKLEKQSDRQAASVSASILSQPDAVDIDHWVQMMESDQATVAPPAEWVEELGVPAVPQVLQRPVSPTPLPGQKAPLGTPQARVVNLSHHNAAGVQAPPRLGHVLDLRLPDRQAGNPQAS